MSNRAISTELIELGERIRKRRQEMKLSQESFAEKAGISVNTVSRIEGGQTAMSVEIFRKMIEILETDPRTRIHSNSFAPVLSATLSLLSCCIMQVNLLQIIISLSP